MTLNEFQERALSTAVYPDRGNNLPYAVLGLVGESGEVAEKVKKLIRDDGGKMNAARSMMIQAELADVLWYCAAVADELGVTLETVANIGLNKLAARKAAGTLNGDGDNR